MARIVSRVVADDPAFRDNADAVAALCRDLGDRIARVQAAILTSLAF